jgi:hypothetical protein
MSNWESDNAYGLKAHVKHFSGSIFASITPWPGSTKATRHEYTFVGCVRVITEKSGTQEFPEMRKSGFTDMREAQAWCEGWITFFLEFLELRRMEPILRQQNEKQFKEIQDLTVELHDYKYPKRVESESPK